MKTITPLFIFSWLAGLLFCLIAPGLAQAPAPKKPRSANMQIIRNPRETVVVISGVEPVDKKGSLVAPRDLAGQMKQAVENLRRLAIRAAALSSHIVTITVFTPETGSAEALKKIPLEAFSDWTPVKTVEARQLRTPGALIGIEAVAIVREAKPR